MTDTRRPLTDFYRGWDVYQGYLRDAIAPLTAEQLDYRAAPSLRTVRELAAHILACRVRWFHLDLGEGGADVEQFGSWDRPGLPTRDAAELIVGLDASWQLVADCLARWTADDLDATFTDDGETFTRQWVIWHVIEHDLHHGGELFLTLGMHGVPTPDL